MPVRVKQRAQAADRNSHGDRDWNILRNQVVGLLLAWSSEVNIVINDTQKNRKLNIRARGLNKACCLSSRKAKNVCTHKTASQLSRSQNILAQASYIGPCSLDSWVPLSASSSGLSIKGAISLDPAPSKDAQFFALGISPVTSDDGNNFLYEEVNSLFAASSFGVRESEDANLSDTKKERRLKKRNYEGDSHPSQPIKVRRKGIERWPIFYLKVERDCVQDHSSDIEDGSVRYGSAMASIVTLVRTAVMQFLTEHHFRNPKSPRKRLSDIITVPARSSKRLAPPRAGNEIPLSGLPTDMQTTCDSSSRKGPWLLPQSLSIRPISCEVNESTSKHESDKETQNLEFNVKLPDFSKGRVRDGDVAFGQWSKIKSASGAFFADTFGDNCQHRLHTSNESAINSNRGKAFSPYTRAPSIENYEAVAADQIPSPSGSNDLSARESCSSQLEQADDEFRPILATDHQSAGDVLHPWTNPVSKIRYLINGRTGLAVTAENCHPHPSPKRLGTADSANDVAFKSLRLRKNSSDCNHDQMKPGEWIGELLSSWHNPVFRPTEKPIPQVLFEDTSATRRLPGTHKCSEADLKRILQESSSAISTKLSKRHLRDAEVVAQIDHKFILVKTTSTFASQAATRDDLHRSELLVLIDQHAADERCRVEGLMEELCTPSTEDHPGFPSPGLIPGVRCVVLTKPIVFPMCAREDDLFREQARHFADWGILYDLSRFAKGASTVESNVEAVIIVKALPTVIAERCRVEPKILVDLMRTEIWKRQETSSLRPTPNRSDTRPATSNREDGSYKWTAAVCDEGELEPKHWLKRIRDCPQGILDMLNSRSCRSSIMFNDELSMDECRSLVRRLAETAFPFHCAHGRPSMIPLVDIGGSTEQPTPAGAKAPPSTGLGVLGQVKGRQQQPEKGFVEAFRAWEEKEVGDGTTI
ncbi:MAG: DNA mismatch repair protein [Sclerophora amabilis]|nr:MAG: DNA mismatch repair protein [Sclerophora amabilis]